MSPQLEELAIILALGVSGLIPTLGFVGSLARAAGDVTA
jgi:hypothetical protein